MINYLQAGDTLPLIAPYAVASGAGVKVGAIFGIAAGAALAGAEVQVKRKGEFIVPCVPADTLAPGAKVYWDDTAKTFTATAMSNTLVGAATVAKATGAISATVLLDGVIR